jgi:hypothetical protein
MVSRVAKVSAAALLAGLMLLQTPLGFGASAPTQAAPVATADWLYTVRPGDDLWRLAARFCGSSAFARRLATHNGLASPSLLQAGASLRIPVAWLVQQPADVEVRSVTGTVRDAAGANIAVGDRIQMGGRLVTGDGLAVVLFADGSTLEVGPDSDVLFNVMTAYGDSGMVDTHLRFYRGRGAARVIKQGGASRFRIWTPSGVAAVRGTDFRVGTAAQAGAGSRVETVTGAVDFEAPATTIAVPAGFGVVAAAGAVTREALLPAPVLKDAGKAIRPTGERLAWSAVPGARDYHLKLYRLQQGRAVPLRSQAVPDTAFALQGLEQAAYRFSVRAVAPSGLEGLDVQTEFQIKAAGPQLSPRSELVANEQLTWRYDEAGAEFEVQLAADESFETAASYRAVDAVLPLANTLASLPGRYFWRVRAADGVFSEPAELEVRPAPVTAVTAQAGEFDKDRKTAPVRVRWAEQPGVRYRLQVRSLRDDRLVVDDVLAETQATPVLPAGRYAVTVTALAQSAPAAGAGSIAGAAGQAEAEVRPPDPRWLMLLILLPALFAL